MRGKLAETGFTADGEDSKISSLQFSTVNQTDFRDQGEEWMPHLIALHCSVTLSVWYQALLWCGVESVTLQKETRSGHLKQLVCFPVKDSSMF